MSTSFHASEAEISKVLTGCPLAFEFCSATQDEVRQYFHEKRVSAIQKKPQHWCYCQCCPSSETIKAMIATVRSFSPHQRDTVLLHLRQRIRKVCSTPEGNQLFRILIRGASSSTIEATFNSLPIFDLFKHPCATSMINTFLEIGGKDIFSCFMLRIADDFGRLARSANGNYAVQVLCQGVPKKHFGLLIRMIAPCAVTLSTHHHGAYVLQKTLKRLPKVYHALDEPDLDIAQRMMIRLVKCASGMITDVHGNFTAQSLIPALHCFPVAMEKFVANLTENFVYYAESHYGHCVLEEFLRKGGIENNQPLVKLFLCLHRQHFWRVVTTDWAEYVVQKMAAVCVRRRDKQRLYQRLIRNGIYWADRIF